MALSATGEQIMSPSQVETFGNEESGCPRKWAIEKLSGIKRPDTPATLLGTRVHELREAWLLRGEYPDAREVFECVERGEKVRYFPGQIAIGGLGLCPKPGEVDVEGEIEFRTPSGILWGGRMDMSWAEGVGRLWYGKDLEMLLFGADVNGAPSGLTPHVGDHKTTKDKQYAKTADTLAKDLQANLYALRGMMQHEAEHAHLHWIYSLTKPKDQAKSWAVRIVVGLEQAREVVGKAEVHARKMLQLYRERPDPQDVTPNPRACSAFGGCPYSGTQHCKLTVSEMFGEAEENVAGLDFDSYISQRGAELRGEEAPPPPPPVEEAPPPPPPSAPDYDRVEQTRAILSDAAGRPSRPSYWMPGDELNPAQAWLKGQGKPLSVIAMAAENSPRSEIAAAYDSGGFRVPGDVINSPEAPPVAPASPEQLPVAPEKDEDESAADELDGLDKAALLTVCLQLGIGADKTKGKREAGLKNLIREARVKASMAGTDVHTNEEVFTSAPPPPPSGEWQITATFVPPPPPAPEPLPADEKTQPSIPVLPPPPPQAPVVAARAAAPAEIAALRGSPDVEEGKPVRLLLIDAFPETGLAGVTYFSRVLEQVMPSFRKEHGVSHHKAMDFGHGAAALAYAVEQYLRARAEAKPIDVLIVDARTHEGLDCLDTLRLLSDTTIRGC
jgi:hypothetical protein